MNIVAATEILQSMIDTLGEDAEISMICISLAPDEDENSETLQVIDHEVSSGDALLKTCEEIRYGVVETFDI